MEATSATLHVGMWHVRPGQPELLESVATTGFPAETVTTLLADWDDAPTTYAERTTMLVLHRPMLAGTR
jgi:alcohol dehydrogenase